MKMKVGVSKVFANFINKTAKKLGFEAEASVLFLNENQYRFFVGDTYDAERYGDYNYDTDLYKVIKVVYPYEYYAGLRFITSKELNDEFVRRMVNDTDTAQFVIRDMIEV